MVDEPAMNRSRICLYSPEYVEGVFSEVRVAGPLGLKVFILSYGRAASTILLGAALRFAPSRCPKSSSVRILAPSGPIGAARCGHSRRRELRLYGVLRSSSFQRSLKFACKE